MEAINPNCGYRRFIASKTCFQDAGLTTNGLPLVAIHIPRVGQLSRKEPMSSKLSARSAVCACSTT